MKKIFGLVLTFLMVFSIFSGVTVTASTVTASGNCGDNVTWTLDSDGVLTIAGTGNMKDYNNSASVPWHSYFRSVKAVVIGNGITSISDNAFAGFGLLTNVSIGNSVTDIGDYAFAACSFTNIVIPGNVKSIGNSAFAECSSLSKITIPNSVTSIGNEAFSYCSSLVSVTIGNNVMNIGDEAFKQCSSLSRITIPNSVTSMGDGVFNSCSALTDVIIGNGITSIGKSSFLLCSSLTEITIPNSIVSIEQMAFYYCGRLIDVYYEGTEKQWDKITIGDYNEELLNTTIHFIGVEEQLVALSGNVKTFGGGSATIELLSGGEVVDTKTVTGNTGTYTFEEVEEGTYKLRVSKTKHATREYEVTVGEADITQDVEIWLYGDVTKDGMVNNADTIQINRKNANLSSVFSQVTDSDYRFKVANVTAVAGTDTIINNADVIQINRMNANLSSVFDRIA